jgi:hypothetical protein
MEEGKHGEADTAERRTRNRRAFPHFLREETSERILIIIPEGCPASCGHQRKIKKTRELSGTRF